MMDRRPTMKMTETRPQTFLMQCIQKKLSYHIYMHAFLKFLVLTLPSLPSLALFSATIIPQMGLISPRPSMSSKFQKKV